LIPPKYVYEGDKEKARKLRRFAQSQLEILRNSMTFQDLKQDRRVVKFDDGTIIELRRSFKLETAIVYVPVRRVIEEEEEKVIYEIVLETVTSIMKQGSSPKISLCEGAIDPFVEPEISPGPPDPDAFAEIPYQVNEGVPPYIWRIEGDDYYFINQNEEGSDIEVTESEGNLIPPFCIGGAFHGYRGGLQGISGMFYALLGGSIITKDICERAGGHYRYLGDITLYSRASCGGRIVVTDICGNEAYVDLEGLPYPSWNYALSDNEIDPSGSADIHLTGGSPPYTVTVSGTDFWTDNGYTETTKVYNSMPIEVFADAAACGSCTITVVDGCGRTVEESIRCTVGGWVLDEVICGEEAGYDCYGDPIGQYKYRYWNWCAHGSIGDDPCPFDECDPGNYGDNCNPAQCVEGAPCKVLHTGIAQYVWGCD